MMKLSFLAAIILLLLAMAFVYLPRLSFFAATNLLLLVTLAVAVAVAFVYLLFARFCAFCQLMFNYLFKSMVDMKEEEGLVKEFISEEEEEKEREGFEKEFISEEEEEEDDDDDDGEVVEFVKELGSLFFM
ncbi:hypothetical protein BRARA_C00082 [Brassica rapa]|uniref:Uncharacterized protein n=2 Tax=Brassica TaxID=3705 RepID=A0A397ZQW1_BRACM|nr:hypothetical protein BRARA_C00082 [Brassica rapa]CAF2118222.1 unnamed protein product [Brassica napus]CAG7878747.1 unnamed protein product [Brassica rapa]